MNRCVSLSSNMTNLKELFLPFQNWTLSTTVIRQVAFSSGTHLTITEWEGLTICEILQNAFSKKRISNPKATPRGESSFSSNRPWKWVTSILGLPILQNSEACYGIKLKTVFAFCFYLFTALISDRPGLQPVASSSSFPFFSLSLSLSVSYLPQLSCPPSHQLFSVISHASQMFHPHYSIATPPLSPSSSFSSSSSSSSIWPPCPPLTHLLVFLAHTEGLTDM